MNSEPTDSATGDESASPTSPEMIASTRQIKSEDIFRGDRIVYIDHAGSIYRLQITSRGKLILQK